MRTILSAAILAALFAMPANAAQCIKISDIGILEKKLGVTKAFEGTSNAGIDYTVEFNAENGYWLIILDNGERACPLVEGTNFSFAVTKK